MDVQDAGTALGDRHDRARTDSSDEQRLDAFMSYSHRDDEVVGRLKTALEERGRNVWIDEDDIPPGAPWRKELGSAIEAADSFVFVISADSLASAECRGELARAVELGKRFVPVLLRPVDTIPSDLAAVQYVDLTDEADLNSAADAIVSAIETDHEWVREHTHWLARALRWDESSRDRSHLARRGSDLQAAERWLARASEGKKPPPTKLQTDYVVASRNAERRGLQKLVAAALVAAAVSAGLAVFALVQRSDAISQRNLALSRELAATANSQLAVDPERSILIAREAVQTDDTPQAREALRQALVESRLVDTLRGHRDGVQTASFSPDGRRIVSSGLDGAPRLWDAATGERVATLHGHSGPVWIAVFAPRSDRLVTAGDDGTARLWETTSGKRVAPLEGHAGRVRGVSFSTDGRLLATAGADGTAHIWKAATGEHVRVLRGHTDEVVSAAFSPRGDRVLTAGEDGTARIWTLATGKHRRLGRHQHQLITASFSRDGKLALTADVAVTRVWNVANGKRLANLGQAFDALFSPDGRFVLTTRIDGTASVWRARNGDEVARLTGHGGVILGQAFSRDGRRAVTAGVDRTARVWEVTSGDQLAVLRGHRGTVNDAAFSPDGKLVVTAGGSGDATARTWVVEEGNVIRGHDSSVESAVFSPDSRLVLTASPDGIVRLWRTDTGAQLRNRLTASVLLGHLILTSARFDPSGRRVLTAGREDGTAHVWGADGTDVAVLKGHSGPVWSAAFSPDGDLAVTASDDWTARTWDAETGKGVAVLRGHGDTVSDADFSPDGSVVVTASLDGSLRRWDARTGAQRGVVVDGPDGFVAVAVSPDGRHVAAPVEGGAAVWELEGGDEVVRMSGHDGAVTEITFNRDGTLLATAADDGTARVWDAFAGDRIAVLRGHKGAVNSVAFSPDGRLVVTAGTDKTARVQACEPCGSAEELLERADNAVTRELSGEERLRFLHRD